MEKINYGTMERMMFKCDPIESNIKDRIKKDTYRVFNYPELKRQYEGECSPSNDVVSVNNQLCQLKRKLLYIPGVEHVGSRLLGNSLDDIIKLRLKLTLDSSKFEDSELLEVAEVLNNVCFKNVVMEGPDSIAGFRLEIDWIGLKDHPGHPIRTIVDPHPSDFLDCDKVIKHNLTPLSTAVSFQQSLESLDGIVSATTKEYFKTFELEVMVELDDNCTLDNLRDLADTIQNERPFCSPLKGEHFFNGAYFTVIQGREVFDRLLNETLNTLPKEVNYHGDMKYKEEGPMWIANDDGMNVSIREPSDQDKKERKLEMEVTLPAEVREVPVPVTVTRDKPLHDFTPGLLFEPGFNYKLGLQGDL